MATKAYIKIAKLRTEIEQRKLMIDGLMSKAVLELQKEGLSWDRIAAILGIAKITIQKIVYKKDYIYTRKKGRKTKKKK